MIKVILSEEECKIVRNCLRAAGLRSRKEGRQWAGKLDWRALCAPDLYRRAMKCLRLSRKFELEMAAAESSARERD